MTLAEDIYNSILSVSKITQADKYSVALLLVDLFCYEKTGIGTGVNIYIYSDRSRIVINHGDETINHTFF